MNRLNSEIIKAYQDYLGDKLVSLVLFGSRARGEATEASNYGLFIIANDLPERLWDRQRFTRKALVSFDESFSIIAKTPEEFEYSLPALYLDLALDGIILFDTGGYMSKKLQRIRELIAQAGLRREKVDGEMMWLWDRPVNPGWELEWGGFVEVPSGR